MQGLHIGDARQFAALLPPQSVQTIITSPPYWGLRSYLPADDPAKPLELGGEATPEAFVANLVALFAALRPALRDDGTLWLNLGDSYAGSSMSGGVGKGTIAGTQQGNRKGGDLRFNGNAPVPEGMKQKDLCGIPWLVAFALRADGWYLRSDIVWHKPNPMPESVRDRPTRAHEYLFLLTKQARYFYDADAIAEPLREQREPISWTERKEAGAGTGSLVIGHSASNPRGVSHNLSYDKSSRNKRSVWSVSPAPFPGSHYATMPPELVRPCMLAGSRPGDLVCDPFLGSGTVAAVAIEEGRRWVGCDLDARNAALVNGRIDGRQVRMGVSA